MAFYSQYLGKTLRAAVDQQLAADQNAQAQVWEELALIKASALPVIRLHDAVCLTDDHVAQAETGAVMRAALKDVMDAAERAIKCEQMTKDKFSAVSLQKIVDQIVYIALECFSEFPDECVEFERAIRVHVKVEEEKIRRGTQILPSDDVKAMDSMIPRLTELD